MLIPKRTKYRKQHRPVRSGMSKGGNEINFGDFAIQSLAPAYVTNRQIEAARIAMTRYIKRGGRVWITIFPDKPITKKPAETRMGSGKGNPEEWVAVVKPGRIMFEIDGVQPDDAREAMRLAINKLPIKCKMVFRENAAERAAEYAKAHAKDSARGRSKAAKDTAAAAAAAATTEEEGGDE